MFTTIKYYCGSHYDESNSDFIKSSDGNFIIVGGSQSPEFNTLLAGSRDSYIMKIDKGGNILWKNFWGTDNVDFCFDVSEMPDKSYLAMCGTRGREYVKEGLPSIAYAIMFLLYNEKGEQINFGIFKNCEFDMSVSAIKAAYTIQKDVYLLSANLGSASSKLTYIEKHTYLKKAIEEEVKDKPVKNPETGLLNTLVIIAILFTTMLFAFMSYKFYKKKI